MRWPRTIFLVALLLIEVVLVISLRTLGWMGTGGAIRWIGCLLAALLPLGMACLLLAWNRGRFSVRAMFAAVTLIALFLFVAGMPLLDFHAERRVGKELIAADAQLHTGILIGQFYEPIGFNPKASRPLRPFVRLPVWLRPLVGKVLEVPPDHAVREMWLPNDQSLRILCDQPSRFESLQTLWIVGVTPNGLTRLEETLPAFPRLVDLSLTDLATPRHWYASLQQIRALYVWTESSPLFGTRLPLDDLRDVACLPNLQMLKIRGYGVTDADIMILAESESLKHIILRGTATTADGRAALDEAMPDCKVREE